MSMQTKNTGRGTIWSMYFWLYPFLKSNRVRPVQEITHSFQGKSSVTISAISALRAVPLLEAEWTKLIWNSSCSTYSQTMLLAVYNTSFHNSISLHSYALTNRGYGPNAVRTLALNVRTDIFRMNWDFSLSLFYSIPTQINQCKMKRYCVGTLFTVLVCYSGRTPWPRIGSFCLQARDYNEANEAVANVQTASQKTIIQEKSQAYVLTEYCMQPIQYFAGFIAPLPKPLRLWSRVACVPPRF